MLEGLGNQQNKGERQEAAVDSGFLGNWVCGMFRWKTMRNALERRGAQVREMPCSETMYRFGSGVAKAVSTFGCSIQVGEMLKEVSVDVIRGGLPLLCGQEAMAQFCLVVDGSCQQILQRVAGHLIVVDAYQVGELPSVNVLPENGVGSIEKLAYPAWAIGGGDSGDPSTVELRPSSGDDQGEGTVQQDFAAPDQKESSAKEKGEEWKQVAGQWKEKESVRKPVDFRSRNSFEDLEEDEKGGGSETQKILG